MKMMVKLAVLLAALLLLTGVAFADWCSCYDITYTQVDDPTIVNTAPAEVCLDFGARTGSICSGSNMVPLSLFFKPLGIHVLQYGGVGCVGSFKFHGENLNVISGDSYCPGYGGQLTVWGHRTDGPCQCTY